MKPEHAPPPEPTPIAELRARIARLGTGSTRLGPAPAGVSLGGGVDSALPWGTLPRAGLHEILAADGSDAARGFGAALLARFAGREGTVMWCRRDGGLYGPGLAAFGLDPGRLLVVHARTDADLLWAMEEGLRSGALAAVLGETATDRMIALRRLQLASESRGTSALLLRSSATGAGASPAVTRWRVGAAGGGLFRTRWSLELLRCRGATYAAAAPAAWIVEWCDETDRLAVVADLRHRSADPATAAHAAV